VDSTKARRVVQPAHTVRDGRTWTGKASRKAEDRQRDATCTAWRAKLDLCEEGGIDPHILDCANRRTNAEVVPLEQLAEAIAVDEIDRRAPSRVASFCVRRERTRRNQKALSPRPAIAPRKSRTALG